MKYYEVIYTVNGIGRYSIFVHANDSSSAKRAALGSILGMPGYIGKRVRIVACFMR